MADVLAVGAHPDDVEICAGGFVAQLVSQGHSVAIADFTRGEMGTRGTAEERQDEATRAAAVLGIAKRINLDLGDGQLEADAERLSAVVRLIRQVQPKLLIAPMVSDFHPDHAATGQLIKKAHYLSGLRRFLPDTEAFRPRHLVHYVQHEVPPPSLIVDISATIETKVEAMRCYGSQMHDPERDEPETLISAPGFIESILARDRYFGSLIGSQYGEAYLQAHPPRIVDGFSLFS